MKKRSAILVSTVLIAAFMTTACGTKTSAERHARQYVHATADDLNPNYTVKKTDSARMMVPFFQQFWDRGVKDRADGMSREQASQRVSELRSEAFLKSIKSTETFAGKTYTQENTQSPKELQVMGETISAAYMDGYEGRP